MAGQNRTPAHIVELLEELQHEPFAFDYYQAVRLLDCAYSDFPQTGKSQSPKDDPFRFSQEASLAFAPATLSDMEDADEFHPPRMVQRFFGLLGPQGPLPHHLTDYARTRILHHRDHTFHRFLDIFHHRMVAFFYQAWAQVRPTVNYDRGVRDRFGEYVASVFGQGMDSLTGRDAFPDLPKRHFSGLFGCQTRHADGLLSILEGYFQLPVDLQQLVGQWLEIPEECTCRLGESSAISTLGESITMGSHIWECQQKFRIEFGPLDLEDFFHLLPLSIQIIDGDGVASGQAARSDLKEAEPELEEQAESSDLPYTGPFADIAYLNARIPLTNENQQDWAEALAIHNGKTLALGSFDDIAPMLQDETQIIDLNGALVVPDLNLDIMAAEVKEPAGCTPTQVHLDAIGDRDEWDENEGLAILAGAVTAAAAQTNTGSWINVCGVASDEFPEASTMQLDRMAPDHCLLIQLKNGDVFANSMAQSVLEIASTETALDPTIASAALDGIENATLKNSTVPRSECELVPKPSNRWHVVEAKVGELLRKIPPTKKSQHKLGQLAVGRVLKELTHADSLNPKQDGQVAADFLVLSQDLFRLVRKGKNDLIRNTRVLKAIRRGDIVFDLLSRPGEIASVPRFRDLKQELMDEHRKASQTTDAQHNRESKTNDRASSSSNVSLESLIALVRSYVGDRLDWDLRLKLKAEETPPIGLGIQGHLGWSTWLLRDIIDRNPDDLILDPMNARNMNIGTTHEYHRPQQWNHHTVGQQINGQLLLANESTK